MAILIYDRKRKYPFMFQNSKINSARQKLTSQHVVSGVWFNAYSPQVNFSIIGLEITLWHQAIALTYTAVLYIGP